MNKFFMKIATLSVGLLMAIGVGVAVGSNRSVVRVDAADQTATWTATSGGLGSGVGSGTIKDNKNFSWSYTRTLSSGASYTGWTSSCIQLGKNGGVENLTLTTSNVPGTIKSVSVECASYQGKHNVSITVGSSSYLASTATSSWTTVETKSGEGTSSGDITISFTGGTRAMYIKSFSVTYNNDSPSALSVTYDGNGNTSGSVPTDDTSYASGATVTVANKPDSLVKTNCEFVEWNTSDDGTGLSYNPGDTFSISASTTLYAIWNQVDFPVTYNKNGGTGTMTDANSPYAKNDTVTVLANGFTAPSGKEFVEWNTESNGGGKSYNPGDTFNITETTTLYAQWQTIVDDGSHITWDLSTMSYESASSTQIVWESSKLTMIADKANSTTNANNYCPPTRTSTRFYKDSTITFAVAENSGIKITSIVFNSTSEDYATGLTSGSWTNATASADGLIATITPSSGKGVFGQDIVGTIGATSGNTQVQITYEYLPVISVSPASIVVEANGSNTTTLSYDHFAVSGVPTIAASVTSGSALTASAVSQSGTTITISAGAATGTVVFTLTGTISAQSATAILTVEVVSTIIDADHIDVAEGNNIVAYKGTDKPLTITVLGENDEEASNQNVSCTSSNASILTVTNDGVITPKSKGVATITILDQDELCTPVVVTVRVRNKTVGEPKIIGVLDLTDYNKSGEGATIANSHYTAMNDFASPTAKTLSDNYYDEDGCVRLGKSGGSGSITITFASLKVARVDVEAKLYSGDSGLLSVTNGSTLDSFTSSSYEAASYSLSVSTSSITISAAGKPRFYVKSVTLFSESVDITNESNTQACYSFEETCMHLDDYTSELGYCKDGEHHYYSTAKSAFNSLNSDQRELFLNNETFADAKARLVAWATANGESLNGSNQLASAHVGSITNDENSNTVSTIIIVSVISLASIGGYFFLRRRKEF